MSDKRRCRDQCKERARRDRRERRDRRDAWDNGTRATVPNLPPYSSKLTLTVRGEVFERAVSTTFSADPVSTMRTRLDEPIVVHCSSLRGISVLLIKKQLN